jgi:hypothetical protein
LEARVGIEPTNEGFADLSLLELVECIYRRSPSGLVLSSESRPVFTNSAISRQGELRFPGKSGVTAGEDEPQPCWLVHDDQARVHAALLEVELPLQRSQDLIINLPLVPQPNQRLALNEKHRQNRRIPLNLIDDPVG